MPVMPTNLLIENIYLMFFASPETSRHNYRMKTKIAIDDWWRVVLPWHDLEYIIILICDSFVFLDDLLRSPKITMSFHSEKRQKRKVLNFIMTIWCVNEMIGSSYQLLRRCLTINIVSSIQNNVDSAVQVSNNIHSRRPESHYRSEIDTLSTYLRVLSYQKKNYE